jgi:hyperosmotically inducible protein
MLGVGAVLLAVLALGRGTKARSDEPAAASTAAADNAITYNVQSQLLASDQLRHANIEVTTKNGVVTLGGTLTSYELRRTAADMARHTGGVVRVVDDMRVQGSTPSDPEVPLH